MTRVDLGLAANGVVVLAVGYAVVWAVGLAQLRLRDIRLIGLSYLLGWAVLGTVLSLEVIAGIGPGIATVVVTAGAVVGICALARSRLTTAESSMSPRRQRSHAISLVPAVLGGAILLVVSLAALAVAAKGERYPDYWDALAFWIPKAETIYYFGGLDADVWRTILHAEYPPLAPAMDAATFHFVGGVHPSVLPLQMTLLGVAFLLAALALLDQVTPRWISLPALALIATAPWFWWRLQTPIPDQPLAYLVTTAALSCVLWLNDGRTAWLVLAFALLAGGSLTKLEGSLMAVLLVVCVAAAGAVLRGRRALPALALLGALVPIVPWRLWLSHHGLPTSSPDYHVTDLLSPDFLSARTDRFTGALHAMLNTWNAERQTAAIICVAIAVILVTAVRLPVIAAAVGAWLALSILGLVTVYWIGRLELSWYLSTSASRVGTTVIIAAGALTPLLLGLAMRPRA